MLIQEGEVKILRDGTIVLVESVSDNVIIVNDGKSDFPVFPDDFVSKEVSFEDDERVLEEEYDDKIIQNSGFGQIGYIPDIFPSTDPYISWDDAFEE